jgi:hypothetical protein
MAVNLLRFMAEQRRYICWFGGNLGMSRSWAGLITVLTLAFLAPRADATVLFTASGGGLSASASFQISGSSGNRQLTILLTNTDSATGANAPLVASQVLTGLFFNLGTSTFTPVSATLVNGGEIIQTAQCDVNCSGKTNVGGEFSYASGGGSWLPGTTQGIASSGYLNANTSSGNFNGTNYDNPAALDGINFGIVPDGWTPYQGNGGLDGVALVDGTVKFVLKIPNGLAESDIKNVYFTYGTNKNEGTLKSSTNGFVTVTGSVPEPAALSMLGLAMAGLGYRLRRRRS